MALLLNKAGAQLGSAWGELHTTLVLELNRLANGGAYPAYGNGLHSAAMAANIWAGTTGFDVVHALNIKAGNVRPWDQFRDINGVCNQLAGTNGLEAIAALVQVQS